MLAFSFSALFPQLSEVMPTDLTGVQTCVLMVYSGVAVVLQYLVKIFGNRSMDNTSKFVTHACVFLLCVVCDCILRVLSIKLNAINWE